MNAIELSMARKAATDAAFDGTLVALWRSGMNTNEIARVLRIPEHEVANRLAFLRDVGKP